MYRGSWLAAAGGAMIGGTIVAMLFGDVPYAPVLVGGVFLLVAAFTKNN